MTSRDMEMEQQRKEWEAQERADYEQERRQEAERDSKIEVRPRPCVGQPRCLGASDGV